MAFILGQDEDLDDQNPQSAQQAPLMGGQSANVGGAAPAATGVGKGGQGGWTNIQNYLSANPGDTGSANALQNEVGAQFGKEKDTMTTAANDYVKSAEDQVNKAKVSTEDADKMIDDSAGKFSYAGTSDPSYYQNVDKMRGALTGAYQGPKSYDYGLEAKTQEYGQAVGKDGNFDGLLKDLYSRRTPNALSQGQYNLQKQLDVHNDKLTGARASLADQYGGLQAERDNVVKGATEKLGGLEQSYRTNQNALRDYLTGKSTALGTSIDQQEADARKAYDQALNSGTGREAIGYTQIMNTAGNQPDIAPRAAAGIWGSDLNWNQLQKENDTLKSSYTPGGIYWYGAQPELDARKQALNSFYGEQDAKYKDVADMDERKFNTLMDFLNSNDARREEGFSVRKK